jgi:hypothetical protein
MGGAAKPVGAGECDFPVDFSLDEAAIRPIQEKSSHHRGPVFNTKNSRVIENDVTVGKDLGKEGK